MSPLSNAYPKPEQLDRMERFYPPHAWVCGKCFLVQLEEFETSEEIFSDYAYFSSYSESRLRHSKDYSEDQFIAQGLSPAVAQRNVTWNSREGTPRGMHFQARPHREAKLLP